MNTTHHRLARYAAIAATPVAGSALGDVTYVSVETTITSNSGYTVSQTGPQGSFSFAILPKFASDGEPGATNIYWCDFTAGSNVNWLLETSSFFQRFSDGEMISAGAVDRLGTDQGWVATTQRGSYGSLADSYGNFAVGYGPAQSGYIGFTFLADDGTGDVSHYGYVSITWDGVDLTLHGYAWENVGGEGIVAGSTAVPGLGGLAALAIGAAGVRSRRQRTVA
ncbi:MAG: hypothetical protein GY911_14750 [Actinomycetales bacterium]|nr:hypothetical protein [Actinomycetales bacterium]